MKPFDITLAQAKAWSILARSHQAGRVASTYLFCGKEGLGSWSLAIELAALLNCQQPLETVEQAGVKKACGECQPCRSVHGLNFEGLHIVVPISKHKNFDEAIDLTNELLERKRSEPFTLLKSKAPIHIPISMAREVKKRLSMRAPTGITRVVIFYQMELMMPASADALLKMIEEPPSNTVIILTTEKPEALGATIRSRAQRLRLERLPEEMVIDYLKQRYELSDTRAKLLARISDGVLGDAIGMAQGDDDGESDRRAVGLLLFSTLCLEPVSKAVGQMTDMLNFSNRGEIETVLNLWQSLVRDCAFYATTGERTSLINVDFIPEIERISIPFASSRVASMMAADIKNTLADMRLNVHIQTALVALVLKLKADLKAP